MQRFFISYFSSWETKVSLYKTATIKLKKAVNRSMRREQKLFLEILDVMSCSVCDHSSADFVISFTLALQSWGIVQDSLL